MKPLIPHPPSTLSDVPRRMSSAAIERYYLRPNTANVETLAQLERLKKELRDESAKSSNLQGKLDSIRTGIRKLLHHSNSSEMTVAIYALLMEFER